MANSILKRLAGKGFIAMRRVNARNIHYLVTPDGRGVTGVVLVGESDLEFLVEWCAEKSGLSFR